MAARRVAPKQIKMLIMNQKTGAMRDKYIQGTFEDGRQAMNYIANTQIMQPTIELLRPHIIIDRDTNDWYYFLDKNLHKGRYHLHYVDNLQ